MVCTRRKSLELLLLILITICSLMRVGSLLFNNRVRPSVYLRKLSMSDAVGGIFQQPLGKNTVIVVSGATSVGKSSVAMELCSRINGEIIVSDSVQVYKHLDIGSNKPTADDMHQIPHHVVNVADPSTTVTTGDFCRLAAAAIQDILSRGKVPVMVGGATMWLQWLVRGIPDAPKATPEVVQRAELMVADLQKDGKWEEGLAILQRYDAQRAAKLFPNDWYRLRRALEIALQLQESGRVSPTSGESLLQNKRTSNVSAEIDFRTVFVVEDRTELYHTIDSRCVDMLRLGHIPETAELLRSGILQPQYTVAKSIGYRQTAEYLARGADSPAVTEGSPPPADTCGDISAFLAYLAAFSTATRNYASKQIKWYRKDSTFLFIDMNRKDVPKEQAYRTAAEEIWHWATVPREEFDAVLEGQVAVNRALAEIRSHARVPYDYMPDTPAKRVALSWLLHTGEYKIPASAGGPQCPFAEAAEDAKRAKGELRRARRAARRTGDAAVPESADSDDRGVVQEPPTQVVVVESAPTRVDRPPPAWVQCIQDPAVGVTPQTLAAMGKPEWSALGVDLRSSGESKMQTMKRFTSRILSPECHASYLDLVAAADRCRAVLFAEKRDVLRTIAREAGAGAETAEKEEVN